MATTGLTEIALEQHDQVYTKVQPAARSMAVNHSQNELTSTRGRSRLLSRSESKKSLAAGSLDSSYLDRQNSKSSTVTLNPRAGLSVFRIVQAARTWKRLSQRKQAIVERPRILLENTYRLGPDADHTFKAEKVQHCINEVLALLLNNFKYSHEGSKRMCLNIASEIKSRVKKMMFPRYKILSHVVIIQNRGQGSDVSSRCLWSPATDSFVTCTLKTEHIICNASVYAVYFE